MKQFILTSLAIIISLGSFAQIVPSSGSLCVGSSLYLEDSTAPGGTWSTTTTTIATLDSGGVLTGMSAGISTVSYTVGGITVTGTYTVIAAPAAVTASSTSFCVGSGTTCADATGGGTWSSSDPSIATVNATTGAVLGVGGGVATIYYTVSSGCSSSIDITVNATAPGSISGPDQVCVGSDITLADSSGTGTVWSSGNTSIATVNSSTGVVTGVSDGTVTISLATTGTCGTAYATYVITVGPVAAGVIEPPYTLNVGETSGCTMYGGPIGSGTWSVNPTTIATIDPVSGNITGIAPGSVIITYQITSCSTVLTSTIDFTVTALDGISGNVIFDTAYYGNVEVWLITYAPGTSILAAIDSTFVTCSGTSVYYQFTGVPTDSFRVKAAIPDSAGVVITGPIPTYHDTSFYWDNASVIAHDTMTSDLNENINMLYGTTTGGPGFIGGNLYTGANRSTSGGGGIPVVGLHIVAMNTTTNTIAGMVSTDVSGNYSFSSLPYGTYTIFPDSLNYATTAYTDITISSSVPSVTGAGFIQHTISNTITPIAEAVKNVAVKTSTVSAFPNPTSGRLNIQWTENATEKGTVSITDVTGREVYNSKLSMSQGTGMTAIDLSALTNGMYLISIKSASLNYDSKIEIVH